MEATTLFMVRRLEIICGLIRGSFPVRGSFAVQFGDHFRSGDLLRAGIICGPVQFSEEAQGSIDYDQMVSTLFKATNSSWQINSAFSNSEFRNISKSSKLNDSFSDAVIGIPFLTRNSLLFTESFSPGPTSVNMANLVESVVALR